MENSSRNQKRNSDIKNREHAHVQKMMKRMEDLERQVKDIQAKLTSAVQLISQKDKEIENLKLQVLQEGVEKLTHTVQERQGCRAGGEGDLNEIQNKTTDKNCYIKENEEEISNSSFFDSEDFETPKRLEETVEERIKRVNNAVNKTEIPLRSCDNKTSDPTGNKNINKTTNNDTLNNVESRQLDESATSELDQDSTIQDSESNDKSEKEADQELEEDYIRLLGQLDEMEKFLGDYGLIWVGDLEVPGEENSSRNVQASVGFTPNFDKVIMVISGINERTASESKIEMSGNIAKFKNTDILKLTIYADGIQLEDNPFREYSSESVQEFFKDLEDGYYPTELKDSYPDGVIFRVIDKRNENYSQSTTSKAFTGKAEKLGGRQKLMNNNENCSSSFSNSSEAKEKLHLDEGNQKAELNKTNKSGHTNEIENKAETAHCKNPKEEKEMKKINHETAEESSNKVYVDYDQELSSTHSPIEISAPVRNFKTEEVKMVSSPRLDKSEERKDVKSEETRSNEKPAINFRDIYITNITYNEAPFTMESHSGSTAYLNEPKYHQKKRPSEEVMKQFHSRTPDLPYKTERNADRSREIISGVSSGVTDDQGRREKNNNYSTDYLEKINANAKNIEQAIKKRASNHHSTGMAINPNENFDHITLLGKKGGNEEPINQEEGNLENIHEWNSGEINENTHLEPQSSSNDILED